MKFNPHIHMQKTLMLPIAMGLGVLFYKWMGYLTFLSPYLIFMMLFITYCKIDFKHFKPGRFEVVLLVVQMALAAAVYGLLSFGDHTVAEGVFICVFIPTATAAPVITSMLGGSITKVASYSLVGNLFVAVAGPLVLAAVGDHAEMSFFQSFCLILSRVFPLIVLPILSAMLVKWLLPGLHRRLLEHQQISFYLWAISLCIIVGGCVSFAINAWTPQSTIPMILLALGALVVCLLQFWVGRKVGGCFGDKVSGGQGLAQKNTVLAVWLALAYMHPIASIAPAAYIAWQNMVNSWQLVRHERNSMKLPSQ